MSMCTLLEMQSMPPEYTRGDPFEDVLQFKKLLLENEEVIAKV